MNQNRIKIIQTVGELLIPLLGYFYWDWNFYFIGLFYFLDLIANTFLLPLKLSKIDNNAKLSGTVIKHYVFYVVSLVAIFSLGVELSKVIIPNFDLKTQSIQFFIMKDMGISQGFFLIPLVFYAAFMQYKMEFLAIKKFERISITQQLKKHFIGLTLTLGILGISFGITRYFVIREIVAVLILILLTTTYSFFGKRA